MSVAFYMDRLSVYHITPNMEDWEPWFYETKMKMKIFLIVECKLEMLKDYKLISV